MRRIATTLAGATLLLAAALPATAQSPDAPGAGDRAWTQLDDLRVATAPYHELDAALAAGFGPFSVEGTDVPTCFDHDGMGMGVHYVRHIDDVVDAMDPEALVYELVDDRVRLVAVEYIVPQEFVEDAEGNVVELPNVLGQDYHKHSFLPVYILHAWVWEPNPAGTYADFNPNVSACPAVASPAPVTSMEPH